MTQPAQPHETTGMRISRQDGVEITLAAPGTAPVTTRPTGATINELLRFAIDKGMPAAELRELVALGEHVAAREARQEFAAALVRFQQKCPQIAKNRTAEIATRGGGKYSYTYAELDEIVRIINPLLFAEGLSYTWDSRLDKGVLTCECILRHVNGHSEKSSMMLPTDNNSAMSEQQKVGAALTFAQRRSLSSVLGLTTTDPDTDAKAINPDPITQDQATQIDDLLNEIKASPNFRKRLFNWLKVETIATIKAVDYQRTVEAIEHKRAGKSKAGGP